MPLQISTPIGSFIVYGIPTGIVVAIIIGFLIFRYPEKVQKWVGIIAGFLSFIFRTKGYFSIKNEVEGKLNSYVADFEVGTNANFPRVKIEWIGKDEEEKIVFEDYETIIVIRNKEHRNKNFVHAAYFFTSEVLLKKVKDKLSKSQKKSLNLFTTKNVLERQSASSVEQFMYDYFKPEIERSEKIREYIKKFCDIEKIGLFFPVLIRELDYIGGKVFLSAEDVQEIRSEVNNLIDFLHNFSIRKEHDDTQEIFSGKYTKCAIKIVATILTREANNIESQKQNIEKNFIGGCENVYIIGRAEDENRHFMQEVAKFLLKNCKNKKIEKLKEIEFTGEIKNRQGQKKKVKTFMIHFHCPENVKTLYE